MPGTVDDYIGAMRDWQAEAALELRRLILKASPGLRESIKWAQPVYESNGPVCYFKAHKAHLTFGFWRGAELMDIDARLETSGSKMAHIKIRAAGEIRPRDVSALVRRAVALNREKGDPTKG